MSDLQPALPRIRNARTRAIIARETFWQITLPLIVILLLVVGLMVFVALSAAGVFIPTPTRSLADVSLMFLILLAAGAALVLLAVLVALCVAAWYGLRELPYLFKRVQDFVWLVAMNAKTATRQVDSRVVEVHLSAAALRSIGQSFRDLFRRERMF
ncbi:MAG: hypothetical protein NZM18_07250 [Thermoflexales bacterium]|nr:hypothetical protein [Thermoflexales bacterium]